MSPGRVFHWVALGCFAAAALPIGLPVSLLALGLVFFTLGHLFS